MNLKRSPARWFALAAAGLLCVLLVGGPVGEAAAQPKPEGEMRWALYVTLSPMWFDPGEFAGLTPFWVLYAIHDALVKPMPGNLMTPSLAESWTVSADQRVYEFKLREGLKFHNGDAFTAEDVKFSFHRAKGSKILHDKVREVAIVDPYRVRFHLREPWPDFMTFYGTLVSGAGWVVPKKYVERVGDDGFKKQPIGLGPYKFVSHMPGIELVMEANESYWRKMPSVKRLVFKSVPEAITRAAMLKRGEVDVAYLLDVPQAQEVKRDPTLKLAVYVGYPPDASCCAVPKPRATRRGGRNDENSLVQHAPRRAGYSSAYGLGNGGWGAGGVLSQLPLDRHRQYRQPTGPEHGPLGD
jgi:peptide/nickel transport system substrate-binding protein